MCRILVRRFDNHRVPTASAEEKPELWHAGDVIEIQEDGVTYGVEGEVHRGFIILELPGVPAANFQSLLDANVDEGKRIRTLDLTLLRTKLTTREKKEVDSSTSTITRLTSGETKLNDATKIRVV